MSHNSSDHHKTTKQPSELARMIFPMDRSFLELDAHNTASVVAGICITSMNGAQAALLAYVQSLAQNGRSQFASNQKPRIPEWKTFTGDVAKLAAQLCLAFNAPESARMYENKPSPTSKPRLSRNYKETVRQICEELTLDPDLVSALESTPTGILMNIRFGDQSSPTINWRILRRAVAEVWRRVVQNSVLSSEVFLERFTRLGLDDAKTAWKRPEFEALCTAIGWESILTHSAFVESKDNVNIAEAGLIQAFVAKLNMQRSQRDQVTLLIPDLDTNLVANVASDHEANSSFEIKDAYETTFYGICESLRTVPSSGNLKLADGLKLMKTGWSTCEVSEYGTPNMAVALAVNDLLTHGVSNKNIQPITETGGRKILSRHNSVKSIRELLEHSKHGFLCRSLIKHYVENQAFNAEVDRPKLEHYAPSIATEIADSIAAHFQVGRKVKDFYRAIYRRNYSLQLVVPRHSPFGAASA